VNRFLFSQTAATMSGRTLAWTIAVSAVFPIGCGSQKPAPVGGSIGERVMAVTIKSSAFGPGHAIPKQYTGDGKDLSPPLEWSGIPPGTKELALICDDPDAPTAEPWVHWVLYKIPPSTSVLPEGQPTSATLKEPAGALQGKNSWARIGYGGPAPPKGHGTHHYHFKLYALDSGLDLPPAVDKKSLLNAMQGHVLAEGELVGTYQR
jgi:Raf kinase inhibitor-like YbhB/YbcL family protein